MLESSWVSAKAAAPERSVAENRHLAEILLGLDPLGFVLGLTQRQSYLLAGKAMLQGGLGQQTGMEAAPGNASPHASVSPLVKGM